MCLVFYYVNPNKSQNQLQLVILFNREEITTRETIQLDVHQVCFYANLQKQNNLAFGQDKKEGGTWFGINLKTGVFAFLTNRAPFNISLWQGVQMWYQSRKDYQSRGKLILNMIKSQDENVEYKIKKKENLVELNCQMKEEQDYKDQLEGLLLKAYIHRYKYRPFNLVVGSLTDKKMFRLNHFLKEREHMNIENEFGSVCNLNDFNKNLEKQEKGKDLFKKIIEEYNNKIDQDGKNEKNWNKLIESLFEMAQIRSKSSEKFYKFDPQQQSIFIDEYYRKFKMNAKFGTRTTTILIYQNNEISMFEKTYK